MKYSFKTIFKICMTGCFCSVMFFANAGSQGTLTASELIKELQSGGYIMYMRHGATDLRNKDKDRTIVNHCRYQRNLSQTGRDQSKEIGRAIQQLKIPIGEVLSSPYCRAKDTAKLTFGDYKIEADLQFSINKNKQQAQELGKQLRQMMLDSDPEGKNDVFVGHTANLKDGLGIWPKPEGVIAVFEKREGNIIFKGMIKPNEWPSEH